MISLESCISFPPTQNSLWLTTKHVAGQESAPATSESCQPAQNILCYDKLTRPMVQSCQQVNKLHSLKVTCWQALPPGHSSTQLCSCWGSFQHQWCRSWCHRSSAGDTALKAGQKISSSLPTSVMVLNNKALGPSAFHLGWQPEEILKRGRLKLITVILVSPAQSPVYWKEVYAISIVSKTSKNKKKNKLITPQKNKRNTMPIQWLNVVQTQLCCCISFSIKKKTKREHF